jgi:hypothetical protein
VTVCEQAGYDLWSSWNSGNLGQSELNRSVDMIGIAVLLASAGVVTFTGGVKGCDCGCWW